MLQHPTLKIETFEGPLDLLLHLISKSKINILDIPVALILQQYMEYINVIRDDNVEVASDFLQMAARLVYIKTMMMLPKNDEGEQLRAELSQELMEYQVYRMAADSLTALAAFDRFVTPPSEVEIDREYKRSHEAAMLTAAFINAVGRLKNKAPVSEEEFKQYVARPKVSVVWGVYHTIKMLKQSGGAPFEKLFESCTKKDQMIAVFMATLELIKAGRVEITENELLCLSESGREEKKEAEDI